MCVHVSLLFEQPVTHWSVCFSAGRSTSDSALVYQHVAYLALSLLNRRPQDCIVLYRPVFPLTLLSQHVSRPLFQLVAIPARSLLDQHGRVRPSAVSYLSLARLILTLLKRYWRAC